jgi:hypothetical protein
MTQGPTHPKPNLFARPAQPGTAPVELNVHEPHIARVYDYWLGGKDNFAADRDVAEQVIATGNPVTENVRANRAFLGRAVRYLAEEAGIRQFLDIGTGLPSANNTHEVAQRIAPSSRIVYVDNDPIVLVHARALLASHPDGATSYVHADARDTERILEQAVETLDFSQPVGLMMVGLMHCIPDADDPEGLVNTFLDAVPSGSYLTLSQPAADINTKMMSGTAAIMNRLMPQKLTYRTQEQVARFFAGVELVEPGLVSAAHWRPEPGADPTPRSVWAGMGRKA